MKDSFADFIAGSILGLIIGICATAMIVGAINDSDKQEPITIGQCIQRELGGHSRLFNGEVYWYGRYTSSIIVDPENPEITNGPVDKLERISDCYD